MTRSIPLAIATFTALFLVCGPSAASAQGFISPFVGFNYGGDAICPRVSDCNDKSSNWGVSFGTMNAFVGFEEEFGYASDFFNDPTVEDSSVLTLMSNVIVGPRLSFLRPYVSGGIGLMKTHVSLTPDSLLDLNNNELGWNFGGGVFLIFGHVGFRGDIRSFHGFDNLNVFGFDVGDLKLNYGRATAGLVLAF